MPTFGLFFWSLLIFLSFFFLLKKFAWKPILDMIKEREDSIENSLKEAARAREEMSKLISQNDQLARQAKDDREVILKEARDIKDDIIAKAREEASKEAQRIVEKARKDINSEKMAALTEIKNQIGTLSISIAEKLLKKEFENKADQTRVAESLMKEMNLN